MPDVSTAYFDQAINEWALGYDGVEDGFIATQIAPFLPVTKQSGAIGSFGQEIFDLEEDARAPKSQASEVVSRAVNAVRFFAQGHAKKDFIADEDRANWGFPSVNLDQLSTENLMRKILRRLEYDWQADLKSGVSGATLSGTGQWSDFVNSDPQAAVRAQITAMQQTIGVRPDTLVVAQPVNDKLEIHPVLKEIVKFTQLGVLTSELIAKALGVKRYIVASALVNTANIGQSTSKSFIWGKDAMLCYSPSDFQNLMPRLAATPRWTFGMPDAQGVLTTRWREEANKSDAIEVQSWYDRKLLNASAGYYWTNAVA